MSAAHAQPPEPGAGNAAGPRLLRDRFLPGGYDLSLVHADVFRAPPAEYEAALEMDLFQAPLARVLLGIRALPQRVEGAVKGRRRSPGPAESQSTFRLKGMASAGWILLGETPGTEIVLGQVSPPWKSVAPSADAPTTPAQFARFSQSGYAMIAAGLRIDPYGTGSSILTVETRVIATDEASRRRFRRYWALVGPFSSLIRRMALRRIADELRRFRSARREQGSA
ncbi:hypothetical protein J2S98_004698 [Arthrobacter oryzae]|uniref:hypothetical protein n=1 Tax=Arthrobacter TaxID=1663 RepID=UPI001F40DAC7|nr:MULTISPECIES: hypothetical protein [Arthrobacter]MDP9989508.1 hypothetical protein [Arthrobacter oryzae]UKA71447.1 hypothetical protein LFT49_01470 [Arthrobacter sp. FW306-06-A]